MATRISNAAASGACDAVVDRLDVGGAGSVEIRSGAQPATADTAASGTLLATLVLPATAFGSASNGVATANAISAIAAATTGTAGWFRAKSGGGLTIIDGSCTATGGGGDMQLNSTSLTSGVNVQITAWTVTMPTT
jgi:hypothetical protein